MHSSLAEGERAAGGAYSGLGDRGGGERCREHLSVVRAAMEIFLPRIGSGALSSVVQYVSIAVRLRGVANPIEPAPAPAPWASGTKPLP